MGKYTRLEEIFPWQVSIKCPVNLLKAAILQENTEHQNYLQLKWYTNSEKDIQSVFVLLQPCDLSNKSLPLEPIKADYIDVWCEPNEDFGSKQLIKITHEIHKFMIQEIRVIFEDETTERYTCSDFIDVEDAELLLPKIPENVKTLIERNQKNQIYRCFPQEWDNSVSRCICGSLKVGKVNCPNCGLSIKEAHSMINTLKHLSHLRW